MSAQDMSDSAERAGPPPATETREAAHRRRLEALTTLLGDLAALRSLDELCRVAVERGPQALGVRRMALWFRTDDPAVVAGSFASLSCGAAGIFTAFHSSMIVTAWSGAIVPINPHARYGHNER